jgi:hypothetical protein
MKLYLGKLDRYFTLFSRHLLIKLNGKNIRGIGYVLPIATFDTIFLLSLDSVND